MIAYAGAIGRGCRPSRRTRSPSMVNFIQGGQLARLWGPWRSAEAAPMDAIWTQSCLAFIRCPVFHDSCHLFQLTITAHIPANWVDFTERLAVTFRPSLPAWVLKLAILSHLSIGKSTHWRQPEEFWFDFIRPTFYPEPVQAVVLMR